MRLVFSKIANVSPPGEFSHYPLGFYAKDLLLVWMRMHQVYCDDKHAKISYNGCYHFYDVRLFPSGRDTVDDLIRRFRTLCKQEGVRVQLTDKAMWYWEGKTCVYGVRFWITAEEKDACAHGTVKGAGCICGLCG